MAGRLQPITLLFKLLDTCNQCALAFRVAMEHSADSAFCGFSGKLQPALGRFVFDLQSEMRRSQDVEWGQPRSYVATAGTASFLRMEAEKCLAEVLAAYE